MSPPKVYPKTHHVYTFEEILQLDLEDCPFLRFEHNGKRGVIQTAHVKNEELLSIEGFAETRWRYERTTEEWIPLFFYVGHRPILDFITIEPGLPVFHDHRDDPYWACPKGFHREQ